MVPEICNVTEFFIILGHNLPFYPLKIQIIKILKNWKNNLEISSFYTSVPKIMIICYAVPEIRRVTMYLLFFILGYFLPFYSPFFNLFALSTAQKVKISKNEKKSLEISSFYKCVPKIMIRRCTVPEIWCATDRRTEKMTYRGGCST